MSDAKSIKAKTAERMAKMKALHQARNEARNQNHNEVKKEVERNSLPKNWEMRQRKAEWLIKDKETQEAVEAKGFDYDRVKLLSVSALEQEKAEKLKKKRKVGDQGFADYETQTARQYTRLIRAMPPKDIHRYNEQKKNYGEDYFKANPILEGKSKDSKEAVQRMVDDLEAQADKRKNFSRRRMYNDDADIDYINEKNAKLNKKLERYYGEYTKEIKQNLERGTAI